MASFPIQAESYNTQTVEGNINDLDLELTDEKNLESSLGNNSATKIAEAEAFMAQNKDIVLDQHARLLSLNLELRAIVHSNKTKQADDEAYNALITSTEYQNLADKIAEIKAMTTDLRDFLIQEGVRGRPPTTDE